jgi:hypothetical protein
VCPITPSRVLPPNAVPLDEAILEGERAASHPHEGAFWRWRRDFHGRPLFGTISRVTVATPYYEVMRAAYARAATRAPLSPPEARGLLTAWVRETRAAFPIRVVCNLAAGRGAAHARGLLILDARGRRLPAGPVAFPDRDIAAWTVDARAADLRGLWIVETRGLRRRALVSLAGMR